jgi:hypothetical protein
MLYLLWIIGLGIAVKLTVSSTTKIEAEDDTKRP